MIHRRQLFLIADEAEGRVRFVRPTGEVVGARRADARTLHQTAAEVERAITTRPGQTGRALTRADTEVDEGRAAAALGVLHALGRAVSRPDDIGHPARAVLSGGEGEPARPPPSHRPTDAVQSPPDLRQREFRFGNGRERPAPKTKRPAPKRERPPAPTDMRQRGDNAPQPERAPGIGRRPLGTALQGPREARRPARPLRDVCDRCRTFRERAGRSAAGVGRSFAAAGRSRPRPRAPSPSPGPARPGNRALGLGVYTFWV
jgi:hypothetical protein